MQIITLTTDWQIQDYYIGAVKGSLYSKCSESIIVDLAHEIPAYNIRQAAFVVRNSYKHFPPGTIHLITVMSHGNPDAPAPLLVEHDHHYFVVADIGMISLMFPDKPDAVYRIKKYVKETSFSIMDNYLPVIFALVTGKKPEDLGSRTDEFVVSTPVRAAIEESVITGSVVYIDSYRNVITNIQKKLFERIGKERPFMIIPGSNHYQITRLSTHYHQIDPGDIFAIFNSLDLLEIGIYQGNAAELLGLDVHSAIRIKFKDK